jgi:glycosyltransferase involved in cell wall biosynthesis
MLMAANIPYFFRSFLDPYAVHFRKKGWKVDALVGGTETAEGFEDYDGVHDVDWPRGSLSPWKSLRAVGRVRELVAREQYDIVHVHTPVASWIVRRALCDLRKSWPGRVVYTAHGFYFHAKGSSFANSFYFRLEKIASPWTDWLVVINRQDEGAARRFSFLPPDRIVYMPGIGVDTARFAPRPPPSPDPSFLMMGEFTREKRQTDAVRALAKAPPHTRLVLAGRAGRESLPVLKLVARLGLQDRVEILDFRNDVRPLIAASCATLMPSQREGLSRAVMESLCMEVPVVGSDARGVRDLLDEGAGLVHPVGDIDAMAEAMRLVLDQPDQAHAGARLGREQMCETYELKKIIRLHEDLYDRILNT